MSAIISEAVNGTGRDSFHRHTKKVMEHVLAEVLHQFDSSKRTRDHGKLRASIDKIYTEFGGSGYRVDNIKLSIGKESAMPFYWKMQEFGTRSFTFTQPFRAVFSDGNLKLLPVKKALVSGYYSDTSIGNKFAIAPGIGLIKEVQVTNPGIRARGFFAYGKAYLRSYGPSLVYNEYSKLMSKLIIEHKKRVIEAR